MLWRNINIMGILSDKSSCNEKNLIYSLLCLRNFYKTLFKTVIKTTHVTSCICNVKFMYTSSSTKYCAFFLSKSMHEIRQH